MKTEMLKVLLEGKVVEVINVMPYDSLKHILYVMKDGELYSKRSFFGNFYGGVINYGDIWIKCDEITFGHGGYFKVLEDYNNPNDKFIN